MNTNNRRIIAYLGIALAVLGLAMLLPMVVGLLDGDVQALAFGALGLAGSLGGWGLFRGFHTKGEISSRDAYLLVVLTWLLAGVYGAIPYMFYDTVPSFAMAFFETISGFTTTGSTIFTDVEVLERSLLLWRSMTHWLGGMGIVVLFISLLSFFGSGGMHMFKAEAGGPVKEKLAPRTHDSAKILWLTYLVLTLVQILTLMIVGMPVFDAICHGFGAIATGGFSTKNASIAGYSPLIQGTLSVLMLMSGINIGLFYLAFKKRSLKLFLVSEELRVYMGFILGGVLLCSWALWRSGQGPGSALLDGVFQVISVTTSTGFVTRDYTAWPQLCQFLLLFMPFVGACAGSTGGGIKVGRLVILWKNMGAQLVRILHPRAVMQLKVNSRTVPAEVISSTQTFFFIYVAVVVVATGLFSVLGYDLGTAFAAVAASVNNVGPALNFSRMPSWSLYFLSLLMLMGRLELYTILLLFTPGFWREG